MGLMQTSESDSGQAAPVSLEALFISLEAPLLTYAHRLLSDPSLAEDVVQEAFLKIQAQFDRVSEHRAWLYRTVHNLALNQNRSSRKTSSLDQPDTAPDHDPQHPPDPLPLPDEQLARWESIGLVRLRLEQLDERSRELIRLKFVEDLSYKEISARTGLMTGHVGYLLHHALKTIAQDLAQTGVLP
jgi:RNA polymerase sigma factor (sigma-70 family)